jgi:hypothetical protein
VQTEPCLVRLRLVEESAQQLSYPRRVDELRRVKPAIAVEAQRIGQRGALRVVGDGHDWQPGFVGQQDAMKTRAEEAPEIAQTPPHVAG